MLAKANSLCRLEIYEGKGPRFDWKYDTKETKRCYMLDLGVASVSPHPRLSLIEATGLSLSETRSPFLFSPWPALER